MKELARNWLGYAHHDLQAAEQLSSNADLTGLAAFHCQQCIEKSFKALLELHNESIPRIHDLITLHQRINDIELFSIDESMLRQIDDTYVDTHYPQSEIQAASQLPSLEKAEVFVALARDIYARSFERINSNLDGGQT